ncbi:LCP family protein [Ktedonospora formicarum]|uniref:Cell envelope-related transcriptional attenuator domain-containing protein n=1 Tax=Ktedonospora formicarum TaxID=2778364 RepID=A0A8J3MVR5_9CHLR|nr:LCP family protein [Ktedonospora formicarum]GHO49600.1 hypothetical protein KSX_77630 [Ktedonospora formicarum]
MQRQFKHLRPHTQKLPENDQDQSQDVVTLDKSAQPNAQPLAPGARPRITAQLNPNPAPGPGGQPGPGIPPGVNARSAPDISTVNTFPSIPQTPPLGPPRGQQPPMNSGAPQMPSTLPQTPRPVFPPVMPGELPRTPPPPVQPPSGGKGPRKKRRFPIWARILVGILVLLLLVLTPGVWYYETHLASSIEQITGQMPTEFGTNGSHSDTSNNGDILSGGRVNILLLGSDTDGKNTAPLAQTDIVVTIDPATNYVGMLSIPRDMRVVIPGYGQGKMDAAFSTGYANGHNGQHAKDPHLDGVGLAIATVEQNFNIHINDYAWVGLDGFVKVVDTAGGVDIDALHPMVDDTYPNDVNNKDVKSYKRLNIAPGPQHMNGVEALEYVRTRHSDMGGDFGRSVRQQQLLSALKAKIQGVDVVTKVPEYLSDLKGHLLTSMDSASIIKLANYARDLDTTSIHRLVLSPPYSNEIQDGSGDFMPICEKIAPDLQYMFGNDASCPIITGMTPTPSATTTYASLPAKEAANPSVQQLTHSASVPFIPTTASIVAPMQVTIGNLDLAQSLRDPLGVNSMLDLLFMVTCEDLKP